VEEPPDAEQQEQSEEQHRAKAEEPQQAYTCASAPMTVVDLRHGSALPARWGLYLGNTGCRVVQEHCPQRCQEAERHAQEEDAAYHHNRDPGPLALKSLVHQSLLFLWFSPVAYHQIVERLWTGLAGIV